MTDHPSLDELSALVRGGLSPERAGAILVHLYQGCETCLAAAPAGLVAGLGIERDLTAEEDASTEAAIDRAFAHALREESALRHRNAAVERATKNLVLGGLKGPEKLPRSMKQLDKLEALLAASWSIRHEDIGLMIFFARLAVECAEQLDPRKFGSQQVFDFQCRTQAELGNAYRVSDQFGYAQTSLNHARRLFELGTKDETLETRLLDLEASFDLDLRHFQDARVKLTKIYQCFRRNGDTRQAGRALLQMARCARMQGEFTASLEFLQQSLTCINSERDPKLAYLALHNQISILCDLGRFPDARKNLFLLRSKSHLAGGRINVLRLRWEEGRINAGLDKLPSAELVLREVQAGFLEVGRIYDSALASIDLAAVLLARRKAAEATEVVAAAYKVFVALNIEQEALMAVLMLRTALEIREATREMVEKVARYLRRIENDPNAKLDR